MSLLSTLIYKQWPASNRIGSAEQDKSLSPECFQYIWMPLLYKDCQTMLQTKAGRLRTTDVLRSCHVERHPARKHNFLTLQPEPECRTPLNHLQTRFVVCQKSTSEHTKYPTYRHNQGRWMGAVSKLLKRNGPSSFTGIPQPVNWSATAFARCDASPQ